jgi:hypothetical protein
MDEHKLIKLLKEHFPTREEFFDFKTDTLKSFADLGVNLRSIQSEIKEMREDIDELKPSAKSLDKILEDHPIERIAR